MCWRTPAKGDGWGNPRTDRGLDGDGRDRVGATHPRPLQFSRVALVAACSRSEARVREVAADYGVPMWYTDPDEMLRDPGIAAPLAGRRLRRISCL